MLSLPSSTIDDDSFLTFAQLSKNIPPYNTIASLYPSHYKSYQSSSTLFILIWSPAEDHVLDVDTPEEEDPLLVLPLLDLPLPDLLPLFGLPPGDGGGLTLLDLLDFPPEEEEDPLLDLPSGEEGGSTLDLLDLPSPFQS